MSEISELVEYWRGKLTAPMIDEKIPVIIRLDGYHVTRDRNINLYRNEFTKRLHETTVSFFNMCPNTRVYTVLDETNIIVEKPDTVTKYFESPNMVYICSFFAQAIGKTISVHYPGTIFGSNVYQTENIDSYLADRRKIERYAACVYYHKRVLCDNAYIDMDPDRLLANTDMTKKPEFFAGYYSKTGEAGRATMENFEDF